MDHQQKILLAKFFETLQELRAVGIVRSDVILGDIGEFLCTVVFHGLKQVSEKTNMGYDALYNEKKVQIKFSNSKDAKNLDLGNPSEYDELIVVLGSESAHRMKNDEDSDYLFYRFESKEVMDKFKVASGYKLSKTKHFKKAEKSYSLS
jgi:hypothetical protein